MSDERRRHPRVRVDLPATLFVREHAAELTARVVDLSEGGGFVHAEGTVERDYHVTLRTEQPPHEARGRVVRCDDDGVGIEFVDADSGLREFVRELLSLASQMHGEAGDE